jgi:glutaredoxin
MLFHRQITLTLRAFTVPALPAVLLASALMQGDAFAQVYRYTDENGRVVYSSQKPANAADLSQVRIRQNTVASASYGNNEAENRDVVIYTAEWCGYCKSAKTYFEELGIDYSEYDIEKSRQAYLDYRSLGGSGLPLIMVGEKKMTGFSRKGFQRLYAPAGR